MRDHLFVCVLGLATLPLLAGCSLSPVPPSEPAAAATPPVLTALPGKTQVFGSSVFYLPCVTVTVPSQGPEVRIVERDMSILAADQSVLAQSQSIGVLALVPGPNTQCGASVSTSASAPVGTSYRVAYTYRFIDGTGGVLTGASIFQ